METPHICKHCDSVFLNASSVTQYRKSFEVALSDVWTYSQQPDPCKFYLLLVDSCRRRFPDRAPDLSLKITVLFDDRIDSSVSISMTYPYDGPRYTRDPDQYENKKPRDVHIALCQFVTEADSPIVGDTPGRILRPGFMNEDIISTIKMWLSACRQGHSSCSQQSQIPKRLLWIGSDTDSIIRLQTSAWPSTYQQMSYAALSYIWGGPQQYMTTKASLDAKMTQIEMNDLPKTLRDAVIVCRAIGIHWLWVDVLCIIQDDQRDKVEQIMTMDDVYRNAAITIIAATSLGSDEGFLSDTFNSARLPFQSFRCKTSEGGEGLMHLIRKPDETPRFPIENRGWTMQERLLSTRLLVFHTGRIDWVCKDSHFFAGCSSSYSVNLIDDDLTRGPHYISNIRYGARDPTDDVSLLERWYTLCSEFHARKLTDRLDRFPATSAIAKGFARESASLKPYIAGLWSKNLAQQLLWRVEKSKHRLPEYLAPTWSWASTESNFDLPTFAFAPCKVRLEILDYRFEATTGSDRYGSLTAASLKVKGRLRVARWNISKETIESSTSLSLAGKPSTLADIDEFSPYGPYADTVLDINCLEIQDARYWVKYFGTRWGPAYTGLLLHACEDSSSTFERVGVFNLARVKEGESDPTIVETATRNLAWFEDVEPQVITLI